MHSIRSSRDHHLAIKCCKMGLGVFWNCKKNLGHYETGWYDNIHNRLWKWPGTSPWLSSRASLPVKRSPSCCRSLRNSSLAWRNSSLLACDASICAMNGLAWASAQLRPPPWASPAQPWMSLSPLREHSQSPNIVVWWGCHSLQILTDLALNSSSCLRTHVRLRVRPSWPTRWLTLVTSSGSVYLYWNLLFPLLRWNATQLRQRGPTCWLHSDDQVSTGLIRNKK